MIDTIIFNLSKDMYRISDPDKFEPSAHWALETATQTALGIQSRQYATKKELLAGIYKPHLKLAHRTNRRNGVELILKIELSLPKLFFGNNFQELKRKDLQPLLSKLSATLDQMGVIIAPHTLARAPISAIHYSKNIALTDGSTPYHYINKIKEANIKLSLDVNQTDYRNEGHSYKWHCNSYEVVFYDKIKDLEKARQSSKRALEKDSMLQLDLFDQFAQRKKLEILRMEVRLNMRQKMRHLFKKLGIKSDFTLKSLFKPSISKKILLHYLDELESRRLPLLDYKASSDKALLVDLRFNNPGLSTKRIFQAYGLVKALEIVNIRELKALFPKHNQRDWYRLMGDVKEIKLPGIQNSLEGIKDQIKRFKPLKLR